MGVNTRAFVPIMGRLLSLETPTRGHHDAGRTYPITLGRTFQPRASDARDEPPHPHHLSSTGSNHVRSRESLSGLVGQM
jgi:hypothetical protein